MGQRQMHSVPAACLGQSDMQKLQEHKTQSPAKAPKLHFSLRIALSVYCPLFGISVVTDLTQLSKFSFLNSDKLKSWKWHTWTQNCKDMTEFTDPGQSLEQVTILNTDFLFASCGSVLHQGTNKPQITFVPPVPTSECTHSAQHNSPSTHHWG